MLAPLRSAAWGWAGWPSWSVLEVLGGRDELGRGAPGYMCRCAVCILTGGGEEGREPWG